MTDPRPASSPGHGPDRIPRRRRLPSAAHPAHPVRRIRRPHPAQPHRRRPEPGRDRPARAVTRWPGPPGPMAFPTNGWLAAYRAAAARAAAAWADDATLDARVEVPWGKIPGWFALAGCVQEILMHGWHLAKATGQPTEGDPSSPSGRWPAPSASCPPSLAATTSRSARWSRFLPAVAPTRSSPLGWAAGPSQGIRVSPRGPMSTMSPCRPGSGPHPDASAAK